MQMARTFSNQLEENENFLNEMWFLNEAHFSLSG